MKRSSILHRLSIAVAFLACGASASELQQSLLIPEVAEAAPRLITVDDMMTVRRIDSLTLSPDGRRFVILVRRGDPVANDYQTGWFVGSTSGGALTYLGGGGEARLATEGPGGRVVGSIERRAAKWSGDGSWIAYTLLSAGELQLWRSRTDGSAQEQLTHNAADVREFAWSEDGQSLYFTVGTARAELLAIEEGKERSGYRYDEDLNFFGDLLLPRRDRPLDKDRSTWIVVPEERQERLANDAELTAFEIARQRDAGGTGARSGLARDAIFATARRDGARAWLARSDNLSFRVTAALAPPSSEPISCLAEQCSGFIEKLWWRGDDVLFLRREGLGFAEVGLYVWSPGSDVVSTLLHAEDDFLWFCDQATDRLICVRQTPRRPAHVVSISLRSGNIQDIADVNPEFRSIRLGKVERFEWQTPTFAWGKQGQPLAGIYPDRAFGYILYPPDFDPRKKYPVYIDPYSAVGFDNESTYENPLHVYAANGILVLNTQFPTGNPYASARRHPDYGKLLYSAELDFPHITMYMESTLRALDTVASRGFIDERRVGIGGVSHGSFVPLHMMLKHDRISAISISGPGWGQWEYYKSTQAGKKNVVAGYNWVVKPEGPGLEFWKKIDLADNVDAIEAPILMNMTAAEAVGLLRLMKHMADAGKPYDAYVFTKETHIKWQPAHLQAIAARNLDWFRFWLQGYEDPAPARAGQYQHWRKLRELREAERQPLKEQRPARQSAAER